MKTIDKLILVEGRCGVCGGKRKKKKLKKLFFGEEIRESVIEESCSCGKKMKKIKKKNKIDFDKINSL